jgi:hypothetical protein
VEGRNGGSLIRHPPGSNGGVHRGPDLKPRVNVAQGTWMKALMDEGQVVMLTQDKKGRPKLIYVKGEKPGAGIENLVTRIRAILLMGTDEEILRAMSVMQQAFPQAKSGKNGHSSEGPIMPNFTRAEAEAPGPEPPPAAPSGGVEIGGKEYA